MANNYIAKYKVLEEAREKLLLRCPQCEEEIEDVFQEIETRISAQSILDDDYKFYKKEGKKNA